MTGKHWEILRASERGPVNVNSVDSYDESRVGSEALHPGLSDYLKARLAGTKSLVASNPLNNAVHYPVQRPLILIDH